MTDKWKLTREIFGPLWKFVMDDFVTDIDWDGDALWLEFADGMKKQVQIDGVNEQFVSNFSQYVANHVARPFNQIDNVLSAETETLRITVAHESLVTSGRCFSIRKSMPKLRFGAQEAIEDGYCPREWMHFLVNSVMLRKNFAFCGEPGHGKTECAKFFSTFIRSTDKVITVEDTLEWHYKYINPGKRADEIKVSDDKDYIKAIKLALRLNPTWLMLSEARSKEVQYLIEGWSTGVHGMTTLHTNDLRNVPDRIVNMMGSDVESGRMINNVYTYLDIGVLLDKVVDASGNPRRVITQIACFERTDGKNVCTVVWERGGHNHKSIPKSLQYEFQRAGIADPFYALDLQIRLDEEARGIPYGMEEWYKCKHAEEYWGAIAEDIKEPQ